MTLLGGNRVAEAVVTPGRYKIFNEAGDLELHVGSGSSKAAFLVSSHAMAKASPVWCRMLSSEGVSGKWINSKSMNGDKKVITLPINHVEAMELVLAWIHLDFDYTPDCADAKFLYAIATIIDLYQLAKVVKPMMTKWIAFLSCLVSANPYNDWKAWEKRDYNVNVELYPEACDDQFIIWIAWVFGRQDIIDEATKQAIQTCASDDGGQLLKAGGPPYHVDEHLRELDIESRMYQVRYEVIKNMLTTYRKTLSTLVKRPSDRKDDEVGCSVDEDYFMQGMCERSLVGSFVTKLHRLGWTEKDLSDVSAHQLSIDKLYVALKSMDLDGIEETWNAHKVCNPTKSMKAGLLCDYNKIPSILTDEEKAKLKERRDLWGYKLTMDMDMDLSSEEESDSSSDYEGFEFSDMV